MIKKMAYGLLVLLILGTGSVLVSYSNFSEERLTAIKTGSKILDTAAGPMEYQQIGNKGPVLLFLHGTPGGYDQAVPIEGMRVLAPSRPGYLRTPLDIGRTPQEQADAYAALMDSLGIDQVIVMGASGGGPSAIAFAVRHPKRTVALIALEAVSQTLSLEELTIEMPFFMSSDFYMWAALSAMKTLMGPEGIVELVVPNPENQRLILDDPAKLKRIESLMWSSWPMSLRQLGDANDLTQFADIDLNASAISVPTLIIHGTEDINVEYTQSIVLAQQIPGAILHTVDGADHMMPFSHSEEMTAAIEEFLTGLGAL